jgi:hypothetical protein
MKEIGSSLVAEEPSGLDSAVPGEDDESIAFFTTSHSVSREKGFWRNSVILSCPALKATALES